jgi:hypothetical protein
MVTTGQWQAVCCSRLCEHVKWINKNGHVRFSGNEHVPLGVENYIDGEHDLLGLSHVRMR